FFVTTLSRKYFVEAGRTNPEKRLMVMSSRPSARMPRRGWIIPHTSGNAFHVSILERLAFAPSLAFVGILYRGWSALIVGCLWSVGNYKMPWYEIQSCLRDKSGWEPENCRTISRRRRCRAEPPRELAARYSARSPQNRSKSRQAGPTVVA